MAAKSSVQFEYKRTHQELTDGSAQYSVLVKELLTLIHTCLWLETQDSLPQTANFIE